MNKSKELSKDTRDKTGMNQFASSLDWRDKLLEHIL